MTDTKEMSGKQQEELARQILDLTKDRLIQAMPYFNRAVLFMPVVFFSPREENGTSGSAGSGNTGNTCQTAESGENGAVKKADGQRRRGGVVGTDIGGYMKDLPAGIGTNGSFIYASPDDVIRLFDRDRVRLARTYLHLIFHCLFQHPFGYLRLDRRLWDFAADVAAEDAILDCDLSGMKLPDDWELDNARQQIRARVGDTLTAEHIYRWLGEHPENREELLESASVFHRDIHEPWLLEDHLWKEMILRRGGDSVGQKWQTISSGVQRDMESYEKNQSLAPGTLSKVFRERYRRDGGYPEFLKKFARLTEEIHVSDEEFDYVYYTYGLHLYRNMPLIEPLEYRESSRIRDFVIAIDTSGSCQGQTIRSFLHKTWNILKESETFTEKMNLHILQCDSRIQKDQKITNEEEFDAYMKEIEILGSGGTDFRPVFRYVDRLQKSGAFTNLRGLLYFTDGYGTFPAAPPEYQTAFVFLRGKYEIPQVPAWAMKVVLTPEELD